VILGPFLRQQAAHLKLLFLPPYSPQLAPIERVWKLTRRLANAQPLFPYTRRSTQSRQCLLQSLAPTKYDLAKIMLHYKMMLHYLRRYVFNNDFQEVIIGLSITPHQTSSADYTRKPS
jgi:hypothetical protein